VLDSTFFKFDQKIYKQNFGTPMVSLLSLIIADQFTVEIEGDRINFLE